jgi:gamma-D-glutamyl-L-lysine dipeptidyl-peptidase
MRSSRPVTNFENKLFVLLPITYRLIIISRFEISPHHFLSHRCRERTPGILKVDMVVLLALFSAALPNAVVLRPVANMYSRPALDADVVSQAIYGSNVGVVESQPGWMRVRTPDDYLGWMAAADLKIVDQRYARADRVAEVESLFCHIYRDDSVTRHAPLLTVPFETRLEVTGGSDRWLSVRLPDDRGGWIQSGDVALAPRKLSIPEMIELSKRFLGLPYTWGGTSAFGYDCSGFMQMLCRRRGVLMPRDAQPQADWNGMAPVDRQDLHPGDLLYFGKSVAKITHTGMYIGDGKFINATTWQKPVVQICELSEPHWTELLVACRRVK